MYFGGFNELSRVYLLTGFKQCLAPELNYWVIHFFLLSGPPLLQFTEKMTSKVLLLNKSFVGSDLFSECADPVISHSALITDSSSELRRILIKNWLIVWSVADAIIIIIINFIFNSALKWRSQSALQQQIKPYTITIKNTTNKTI